MTDSLRTKTLHGLSWSFLERIGQQGIQFVITIVLARLLLPEQFGLIAMLGIFMAVAQSFIDSGFGSALIQKKDATYLDECSIFYFNIAVSVLAAILLCLAAPGIAAFYDAPPLTELTRALSLNLVINAFGLIHIRLLMKRIDFKAQMKISMVATACSGTVGITMAYQGFGVWSLVTQSLGSNLVNTLLLWWLVPWRPRLVFSLDSLRSMFGFGSKLLLAGLLNQIFANLYTLVIGRLFSAADLGFYTRAKRTQALPAQSITGSVNRVTFPVFAGISDDKPRLKRAVKSALGALAMLNFPLMIGLAVVAEPLVEVVFTERWLPSVPYLQLACIVGLFHPLHSVNCNVLTAQGRSDLLLRLEILKKICVVLAISVTWRWGIVAMIYGQIATTMAAYYVNSYYTGKLLEYPLSEQLRDLAGTFALGLVMGAGVYSLGFVTFPNTLLQLITQVLAGIALYFALCDVFRLTRYLEAKEIALSRLRLLPPIAYFFP